MSKEKTVEYDFTMSDDAPMWKKVLYNIIAIIAVIVISVIFFGVAAAILVIALTASILWFSWLPALVCWGVWTLIAPVGTVLSYWTWLGIVIIVKSLTGGFAGKKLKVSELLGKIDDKLNLKLTNIKE
jgi:hypothetical protein